jgi:hypothetical protein
VVSVDKAWHPFQGYNEIKRKKTKEQPLSSSALEGHAAALLEICLKPCMVATTTVTVFNHDIKGLADCLLKYSAHLKLQLDKQTNRQKQCVPARLVCEDVSVQHRHAVAKPDTCYLLFDEAVTGVGMLNPILFVEDTHLVKPFTNSMQRYRFIENLHLSVDVDIVMYCPGGSICTTVYAYQVDPSRSDDEAFTQSAQIVTKLKPSLPEYHTRQMKREFKARCTGLATVTPAFLDGIYRELTMDASAASRPDVQERIRLILLGETGLVPDLRSLNTGRPLGTYDQFFSKMATVIEETICADERRHGVAHVAPWLSLRDLVAKTTEICEPDTQIPSKSLVRLQFTPRNQYTHTALNFTSRFEVQYKVQRRQLRAAHPDMHYCSAQLRYLKELAVIHRESCVLFFCDDKAKIPYGEPGHVLSTGVRGKQSLAPSSSVLGAEDHDVHHKGLLTPSVYLQSAIPQSHDQSFCRGQVTVVVNDNILQPSSPVRHAAAMIAMMRAKYADSHAIPSVLLKYSDGGTDQRNTLESVKCSLIAIFKLLHLDMVIAGRCAPGQSWSNPAERIMSLLNIALQNCALERPPCSDDIEKIIAKCNGMQAIREAAAANQAMSGEWAVSSKNLQDLVASRFRRLSLKDEPIATMDPVSSANIVEIQECLAGLFPGIEFDKLTKNYLYRNAAYRQWIDRHCRERTYTFQIKRCDDTQCCSSPTLSVDNCKWLPDPELAAKPEDNAEPLHYKKFAEVFGRSQDTTESDKPSSVPVLKRKSKLPGAVKQVEMDPVLLSSVNKDASVYTVQCAKDIVFCIECRKPRVVYSKHRLTGRQSVSLKSLLAEIEYSCGDIISAPWMTDQAHHNTVHTRLPMNCADPIEMQYYSADLGRKDICCYCCEDNVVRDDSLLKKFKTVLPLCKACNENGFEAVCQRPYGKDPN